MANFPSIAPSFNAQKKSKPIQRVTKFGDGYEHRIAFGLNQSPKEWTLTFMVDNANADTIETFLDARGVDGDSFGWTPPSSSTALRWVCQEWNRELLGENFNRIDTTFRQVFEP